MQPASGLEIDADVAKLPSPAGQERTHRLILIEAGFAEWRYRSLSRLALYAALLPALPLWVFRPSGGLPAFLAATSCAFTVVAGASFSWLAWRARRRRRGHGTMLQSPPPAWRVVETVLLWIAAGAASVLALPAFELVRTPGAVLAWVGRFWSGSAFALLTGGILAGLPRTPVRRPRRRLVG